MRKRQNSWLKSLRKGHTSLKTTPLTSQWWAIRMTCQWASMSMTTRSATKKVRESSPNNRLYPNNHQKPPANNPPVIPTSTTPNKPLTATKDRAQTDSTGTRTICRKRVTKATTKWPSINKITVLWWWITVTSFMDNSPNPPKRIRSGKRWKCNKEWRIGSLIITLVKIL